MKKSKHSSIESCVITPWDRRIYHTCHLPSSLFSCSTNFLFVFLQAWLLVSLQLTWHSCCSFPAQYLLSTLPDVLPDCCHHQLGNTNFQPEYVEDYFNPSVFMRSPTKFSRDLPVAQWFQNIPPCDPNNKLWIIKHFHQVK